MCGVCFTAHVRIGLPKIHGMPENGGRGASLRSLRCRPRHPDWRPVRPLPSPAWIPRRCGSAFGALRPPPRRSLRRCRHGERVLPGCKGGTQGLHEIRHGKRLGEERECPTSPGQRPRLLAGKGADEHHGQPWLIPVDLFGEVQAIHPDHPVVGHDGLDSRVGQEGLECLGGGPRGDDVHLGHDDVDDVAHRREDVLLVIDKQHLGPGAGRRRLAWLCAPPHPARRAGTWRPKGKWRPRLDGMGRRLQSLHFAPSRSRSLAFTRGHAAALPSSSDEGCCTAPRSPGASTEARPVGTSRQRAGTEAAVGVRRPTVPA